MLRIAGASLAPIPLAVMVLCAAPALAQQADGNGVSAGVATSQSASSQQKKEAPQAAASAPGKDAPTLREVKVTAEEELKQAPGVSTISKEDIEKRPPVNDLSEIVRRMPGANLTGNSSSGYRGNNRQIDLRGMGPENTLILIDGKPVESRNSVRYARAGDRDTRGDSNWVPASEVESVEVIRGPAAARYGSGAAGGVVNIITKGIPDKASGSISTYVSQPDHKDEGATHRITADAEGPLSSTLGYRVYANYNKTDADDPSINAGNAVSSSDIAAGREGVTNKDVSALLRWQPAPGQALDLNFSYSRQGNIYAGDTETGAAASYNSKSTGSSYLGQETNLMIRNAYSLEHRGTWDFGTTKSYLQYEQTHNRRLDEGLTGGVDGNIDSDSRHTAVLNNYTAHSEVSMPLSGSKPQTLTTGVEFTRSKLSDPASILNSSTVTGLSTVTGISADPADRSTTSDQNIASAFVEDNIEILKNVMLTPGLRLDNVSGYGNNWSPSLNTSYYISPTWTLKGGIARAFKAPNLYQIDPDYLYVSSGNGCNAADKTTYKTSGCYILGNNDLKPEISWNKEIGLNWASNGWNAGITWFRNDYDSKIVAGTTPLSTALATSYYSKTGSSYAVYQWENVSNAVIEGWEANLQVPVSQQITWSNNFTFMKRNSDEDGQPLSVIPKFTLNTTMDWQATEKLSVVVTGTFYGEQKPRTTAYNTGTAVTGTYLNKVAPYNIWGISAGYKFNTQWSGRIGISNIFDKRLYREGDAATAGAATYNEPGRAYYAMLTTKF